MALEERMMRPNYQCNHHLMMNGLSSLRFSLVLLLCMV